MHRALAFLASRGSSTTDAPSASTRDPSTSANMSDNDAPTVTEETRGRTTTSGSLRSRSKSPSAVVLGTLVSLVQRTVTALVPTAVADSVEAPVLRLRDDIMITLANLQDAAAAIARGDLLGAASAKELAAKTQHELALERALKEQQWELDRTRRELDDVRDSLYSELARNHALAELYQSSHARRQRAIEELAMVKVALDRALDERNAILAEAREKGILLDSAIPPVPPLPETLANRGRSTSRGRSASRTSRSRSRDPSVARSVHFEDDLEKGVTAVEPNDVMPLPVAPEPIAAAEE
ncbi:hypothetical protein AMAG_09074 [Allomyces macrogynus ATCC 38327]|uniref:Uncharacterized protein n=1 Tax=Allomyces macrogynus (strain ATCC 38327) TaxID=578462 RepID=A0A0L0SNQ8_ALLM3|nr:hypothetical protein AMAG_09074 [Allomyces macrogynus ATCC 38327]|eukprot:KNE64015.1 hypothetical protein AMAG_09074 [Allomyces macrogynus ATCC 38327]